MCRRVAIITSTRSLNSYDGPEGQLSRPMMKVTGRAEVVIDHEKIVPNRLSDEVIVEKNANCIRKDYIE